MTFIDHLLIAYVASYIHHCHLCTIYNKVYMYQVYVSLDVNSYLKA